MMKIEGIVLAAGLSSRMGRNKLTLDLYGKTIIERCIDGMYDLCSKVLVVVGHRHEEIEWILDKYSRLDLVYNPNHLDGMFSSIKKGMDQVKADRFFLIPGDYPVISKETYRKMLKVDEDIVIPTYQETKGHPLLMKRHLIKEVLTYTKYKSLRDFVNGQGYTSIELLDPGILMDADTMEDYREISLFFKENYYLSSCL